MTEKTRPSDAQLRSAADRIRRLSAGLESPSEESADLATFSEEAIRRTYRIVELGVEFWMDLLRLNPDRKLAINGTVIEESAQDPGWLFGRTLGATIRSWGDLKNAQRGLLWFDSSPLLGPKIDREVQREHLEGTARPGKEPEGVVRLLSRSAVAEIQKILKERWGDSWNKDTSPNYLWLGLQSGALEREQRNPQGISKALLRTRRDTVLAYCLERDVSDNNYGGSPSGKQVKQVKLVESKAESLPERFDKLKLAQGGSDTSWRPLYSFLRRGDVVALTLAGDVGDERDSAKWGSNWSSGRPLALAIVTSPTNWDSSGWWGRLGSVLLLDGPTDPKSTTEEERRQDRERLRTAFRFPSELTNQEVPGGKTDRLADSFGFAEESDEKDKNKKKTTDSLGLERIKLYRGWLGQEEDSNKRTEGGDESHEFTSQDKIDQALIEPIPVGFPGPWRRVKNHDLRATLGEFLEPHAVTIGFFEHRHSKEPNITESWKAWYPANLNVERFAMTSDNLRLGVTFDNPLIREGRSSAQRIAPDPLPDLDRRAVAEENAKERAVDNREWARVEVANSHRLTFDHYKRGMTRGTLEEPPEGANEKEQKRAAAFMPAITLEPESEVDPEEVLTSAGTTSRLWPREDRSSESEDPRALLAKRISNLLGQAKDDRRVTIAAFPDSERTDLYRALDSRAFAKHGLSSIRGKIPIDPAGTRIRDACLITKGKGKGRLLIVLTDDSVAAVDIGAIAWLLLAYGPELRKGHLLDEDAYVRFRQRDPRTRTEEERRSRRKARKRSRKAWELLKKCRLEDDKGSSD